MTQKTRICIILLAVLLMLFLVSAIWVWTHNPKEVPQETPLTTQEEPMVVASVPQAVPYAYILQSVDDNLVVYLGDGQTVYMETGIRVFELSEELQDKAIEGIGFPDAESLFTFLENYAS